MASNTPKGNSTTITTIIIIIKTLQSEWFKELNRFINDFTTIDNWHTARQNIGLYTSTENNIVVFILINDYNRAGISLLLKRYKEAAIFSLYTNKSIYNSNVY